MPYRCHSTAIMMLFVGLAIALAGCDSGSDSQASADSPTTPVLASATGRAQKGPFQPGGTVSAFRLQDDGSRGREAVSGEIERNGRFRLAEIDGSGPIELEATGAFLDEFRGNFTMGADARATLTATVALAGATETNINLFSHFVAARAQALMADGTVFADARDQARSELAAIMGIGAAPSTLDLLQDDGNDAHVDDSANLLLFSAAALAGGVNQAGIGALATDFADNGQVDGAGLSAFDAIKQATLDHPDLLAAARTNLQNQYSVTPPDDTDGQRPAWAPAPPAGPVAAFTTSGPMQVDASQSFDAGGSTGDGLSYAWAFGDGESASGAQPTHVYASADDYTVTLTVTDDANRSDTARRDLSITAVSQSPAPPTAALSFDGDLTAGASLSFDGRDSTGATLSYAWDFGNGESATGAQPTYSYAQAGTYTVTLTVTDRADQTDTATQRLRINAAGPSAAFTTTGPATAGQAQPFDATGSSGDDLTYYWTFGDGDAATNAQVAHIYDSAGDYSVKLTVTDGEGNTDSASQSVTVGAGPQPVTADGAIDGTVTDTGGDPLQGVQVRLVRAQDLVGGARDATTDTDGKVSLANLPTGVAFVLKLTKDGYGERFVRTTIPAGASDSAAFAATLIKRESAQTLTNAENGGSVTGSDGTAIELPADALVDESGNPVSGDVEVSLTPVDVGDTIERDAFPGSFAAADENGQDGLLLSFGVAEYRITQNGEELQLAAGKQATLTVPIYIDQYQDGSAVAVGDSIPLWSLDETTGQWIQEGTGTVVASSDSPPGLAFEITAGHLSWYNCDNFIGNPYRVIPHCKIESGNGVPTLDISETCTISGRLVGGGPYSSTTTNIVGNNDGALGVPANVDYQLIAAARNGTLRGTTTVNGAGGASDTVEVVLNRIGGGAGEAISLPYNEVATIDPAGQIDRYTLTGSAGQVIRIEVTQTDGSDLEGQIRLQAPDGQHLISDDFSSSLPLPRFVELPDDGEYTLAIDGTANEPGAYRLLARAVPEISLDQNIQGRVAVDDGVEYRQFHADAGTVIGLASFGAASLEVTNLDQSEMLVGSGYNDERINDVPADGTYLLRIEDESTDVRAEYRTAVARIEPPQALSVDGAGRAVVAGDIQVYGDHQFYQLTAAAGDGLFARLSGAGTDALTGDSADIRIYRPDGRSFYQADPIPARDSQSSYERGAPPHLYSAGLRLPGDGADETYLLEVVARFDSGGNSLGGYQLQVDTAPMADTLVVDDDLAECTDADSHSVRAAAYAVTDGGTLDVCSGQYSEYVPVTAPDGSFSIVGRNRGNVLLQSDAPNQAVVRGNYSRDSNYQNEANIRLENLTLQTRGGGGFIGTIAAATNITVEPAPGETDLPGSLTVETDGAVLDGLNLTTGDNALTIRADDVTVKNSIFTGSPGAIETSGKNLIFKDNTLDLSEARGREFSFSEATQFGSKGGGVHFLNNSITATAEDPSDLARGGDELIVIGDDNTGATGAIVRGNVIQSGVGGLVLEAQVTGTTFTVEQNRIELTPVHGGRMLTATAGRTDITDLHFTVRNNIFDGVSDYNGGLSFQDADQYDQADIINNTLRSPDREIGNDDDNAAVRFTFPSNETAPPTFPVNFINNILEGPNDPESDGVAVRIDSGVQINADNNLFHEFGTNYADGTTSAGGNDITGMDPLFINDLLEVESTSPAVNAGQGTMAGGPPISDTDYDGTQRPQGANYDIGAHEQ